MQSAKTRGFTLIELLVVVAIIALLVAILIPSLARARHRAVASVCLANQKAIGQAQLMYAGEYDRFVPRDGYGGWGAFFAVQLGPYLGGGPIDFSLATTDQVWVKNYIVSLKVMRCPAVRDSRYYITYAVNSIDFVEWNNRRVQSEINRTTGYQRFDTVRRPQTTLYTAEINMTTLDPEAIGSYNVWRTSDLPFNPTTGAIQTGGRMISATDVRHQGSTMVSFFDGHAEPVRLVPAEWPVSIITGD
jgi:prepilin-type N-terminal cleavage/methylation domain-containing protein/prepilin-type processing-associated H-X9-DG protein